MKPSKLAAITAGVVVALIVGAIAYVTATFDAARVKAELGKAVHDKTQRTLRIDGDLSLSFWPNVGVEVGKVSLSEFRSDREFAAVDHARVSVAALPLLARRVVVDAVELDGARATLVKHKDGTLNIADLMAKDKAKEEPEGSALQVAIAAIRVADMRLVWRDEQSGRSSTLTGRLEAALASRSAKGEAKLRLDESNIALKFEIAPLAPPSVGFDLDIDRIDVDRYLPPAGRSAEKKDGAGGDGGGGRIDLSALKTLNAHGNVHVGHLQFGKVRASDVKLKLTAADGKLDVAPHSMNLYDGRLAGELSVNASGNRVALREALTGVSINPLMRDAAGRDLIEGCGDVHLDLNTHGDTVAAMKKALGGTAAVVLRDGALKGINLAKSFREMKAMVSRRQNAIEQARATDKTDFSEMTASFRIANGVAHNDDLMAKSPFLRLGGSGDIDIGNGRVDYLAKASVVGTSGGQGAKELGELQGVTVPVRVSGPFDGLSYRIEYGAVVDGALKAKVEETTQELKQRAGSELLKGLFGK